MALEANNTWMREQPKTTEQHLYLTDSVQTQQRPPAKVLNKQLTQTERFTQTEYRSSCVELVALSTPKDSIMFEQQQHQSQPTPVQMYSTIDKKDISQEKGGNVSEFPFCYNVNMLQKVHHTQSGSPTATAVASIASDDKTCYRFDVAQPFGYNYTLVNQMSLAAATSSATFKCDVCGLVFNHVSLLNHHKRIHNGETNGSPDRSFSNEQTNDMKLHLKSQAKCRTCNRCGGQVIDCDHSNSNSKKRGSKYVKCENCQAGPTSTTTAITSNGSFHSSSPEPPDSPPEVLNISSKQLQLVKRHGQGMATVTKCHKCNGSGLIFIGGPRSPPSDKPYRCNICEGSFSRYSSLWSHKRLHSGDKPFKCDMCGLTFARAAYLKNHIRVHSGEKPYKCNVCGMQFSQSPHLKNHERIHSGERPYQCEICEKTFARHSTLWNHRRIHTGEKPYRCSVCGSAFNQATHLKNHAKVHTGEKPHRCDICEVGFSDRFALKRHKSIHDKYGKVSKNHTSSSSMEMLSKSSPQHLQDSQHQIGEMYKCDVAFPGQQPSSSSNSQHSQHSAQSDMFKCDASTSVAFGTNPNDTSQQQTELFKCDVGTSVSFPVQTQQASQSNSSTTQAQSAQMNEGTSNNMSYQNQQSSQKQNGASSLGQSETYKYDVSFTGQTQQDSSQSGQYDLAQQNQQKSTDAKTQQLPQSTLKTLYTNEHSDAILGP